MNIAHVTASHGIGFSKIGASEVSLIVDSSGKFKYTNTKQVMCVTNPRKTTGLRPIHSEKQYYYTCISAQSNTSPQQAILHKVYLTYKYKGTYIQCAM